MESHILTKVSKDRVETVSRAALESVRTEQSVFDGFVVNTEDSITCYQT